MNASLLIPNKKMDHIRRLLKKGEKIFLLSDEEKKMFTDINFDSDNPKTVLEEFKLASKITTIPLSKITGIGVAENLITVNLKKTIITPDNKNI
jgi:hypothetical protein